MFGGNITQAVNNGSLPISRVDDMVRRVMTPYFYLYQDNYPPIDGRSPTLNNGNLPPWPYQFTLGAPDIDVRGDHADFIRELGATSIVLLKNTNNALPLRTPQSIGIFGNDAGDLVDGLYFSGGAYNQPFGYGMFGPFGSLALRSTFSFPVTFPDQCRLTIDRVWHIACRRRKWYSSAFNLDLTVGGHQSTCDSGRNPCTISAQQHSNSQIIPVIF